jgi:acyl dehydratase
VTRYWEDFTTGEVIELGSYTITRAEMLEFARRYDPQPFHLDEQAAAAGPFGGLAASGWLTAAVWMRLYAMNLLNGAASRGSPGVEELRWLAPVFPDVELRGRLTITDTQPSTRRGDRGTIFLLGELLDPAGQVVFRTRGRGLIGRRPT